MRTIEEVEDGDYLVKTPILGNKYHLSWARKKGMVWVLKEVSGTTCTMQTPKTGKLSTTHISTLRHTNKDANKNAIARIKEENTTVLEDTKEYTIIEVKRRQKFTGCQCFKDCSCADDFVPFEYTTIHKIMKGTGRRYDLTNEYTKFQSDD